MKNRKDIKTVTTRLNPKTRLRQTAVAQRIRARANTVTTARRRLPIVSVEDIIET